MKYGILIKGETEHVIYECKTLDELREALRSEAKNYGIDRLRVVKFLQITINLDDGLDDAVIGGVER